ncbi:MAG: glycogen/starch/alpha-glucan family phosphorylase [Gammaproteobacteria bacterium]|nr:glycogen/starch/alpha-glucan family phosphorylase [Gammaproteobacteria bacterium]
MNQYFRSTEDFKKEFSLRLKNKYLTNVKDSSVRERYNVLGSMVMDYLSDYWIKTDKKIKSLTSKKVYYFSMEFLLGRMIESNINSLGIREVIEDAFKSYSIKLSDVLHYEKDPGLGNGGLGRLAACYFDSLASLSYPAMGNTIRYRYGLFKQKIKNGYQEERPDNWLSDGFVWEIRRDELSLEIPLYGYVDYEFGKRVYHPAEYIKAVPYDVPIVGYNNKVIDTLRIWNAEPAKKYPYNKSAIQYEEDIRKICGFLYPDDSSDDGKRLRLVQQYFLSASGIRSICRNEKETFGDLKHLSDHVVIHLNDTHPTLVIPELMRILLDEEGFGWDEAFNIVSKSTCYTNHSLLKEVMETWNTTLVRGVLPRVMEIIDEINKRFVDSLYAKGYSKEFVDQVAIIKDNTLYMANLCSSVGFKVNGVAKLHSDLLRDNVMKEFSTLYPEKFENVTNGITPRRWLMYSNDELSSLLDEYTPKWRKDFNKIRGLLDYENDRGTLDSLIKIKNTRKQILAKFINESLPEGSKPVNYHSIFDVQIKRLHEYKRQLLNALHIIYLYIRLKEDKEFRDNFYPHTFIFGAKAASGYHFAKKVIKLINTIAKKIDSDDDISDLLKVVFIENYGVTIAEVINPAIDLSEQISLAGYEASGTGNMKAMMNGAVTIGTLDGANVEIYDEVGDDNMFIFGLTKDEVLRDKPNYTPKYYYDNNEYIRRALNSLVDGFFDDVDRDEFREIYNKLLFEDPYMVLADFESYRLTQEKVNEAYKDRYNWAKMSLVNIAKSNVFSSDRSIEDYNERIWHLEKIK